MLTCAVGIGSSGGCRLSCGHCGYSGRPSGCGGLTRGSDGSSSGVCIAAHTAASQCACCKDNSGSDNKDLFHLNSSYIGLATLVLPPESQIDRYILF
jgi:hypothetical protein